MERLLSRKGRKKTWLNRFALLALLGGIASTQGATSGQEQKTSPKGANTGSASGQTRESAGSSKPADAAQTGNVEDGKKLFLGNGCFECHGTVGQGSTATGGTRIGPPVISFDEMVQYVHHPSGQMPPYTSKVISDHDLADIYAYLKSQPKPQPAKNIPLLNQ